MDETGCSQNNCGVHLHFVVYQGKAGLQGRPALWGAFTAYNVWGVIEGLPSSPSKTNQSTKPQAKPPAIASVSPIAAQRIQTITITGTGFGTQAPYDGNSSFIVIENLTQDWRAGWKDDPRSPNYITLNVTSWTDTRIVIAGLTGNWSSHQIREGDRIKLQVWNPQTKAGPAAFETRVGQSTPATTPGIGPTPANNRVPINREFDNGGEFIITLTSFDFLPDGRIRANVTYRVRSQGLFSATVADFNCGDGASAGATSVTLPNGQTLASVETFCSQNPGYTKSGQTHDDWAIYVRFDTTQPFTISWGKWGKIPDLRVVR
jgi:hypothetical protein